MLSAPKVLILTAATLLASCGSIPTRDFEIRAVNTEGRKVPCLIVVDGKWPMKGETENFTDSSVTIAFRRPEMRVLVKPARVNAEGKIVKTPGELDPAPYKTSARDVRFTDPKVQLFIVEDDRDFQDFQR